MKKTFTLIAGGCLLSLALFSCQGTKPMDAAQKQAKADSIYNASKAALIDSSSKACTAEWANKVRHYTDSLVNLSKTTAQ